MNPGMVPSIIVKEFLNNKYNVINNQIIVIFYTPFILTTARVGSRSGSLYAHAAYYGVIPKAAEPFDNGKINVRHLLELDCKVSIEG